MRNSDKNAYKLILVLILLSIIVVVFDIHI